MTNAKVLTASEKYKTEIITIGKGHDVGLMFALAGKKIITEIKCPLCGKVAPLNIHWQGFMCKHDDIIWELCE